MRRTKIYQHIPLFLMHTLLMQIDFMTSCSSLGIFVMCFFKHLEPPYPPCQDSNPLVSPTVPSSLCLVFNLLVLLIIHLMEIPHLMMRLQVAAMAPSTSYLTMVLCQNPACLMTQLKETPQLRLQAAVIVPPISNPLAAY